MGSKAKKEKKEKKEKKAKKVKRDREGYTTEARAERKVSARGRASRAGRTGGGAS